MIKNVKVVAAVIQKGNKILISSRPNGKYGAGAWEFPGGKLELGESVATALRRELFEELNITEVNVLDTIFMHNYVYPDMNVHLQFVRCILTDESQLKACENQEFKWVERSKIHLEDLLPADELIAKWLKI